MDRIDTGGSRRIVILDERLEEAVKKSGLGIPKAQSSCCEKSMKVDFASGEDENGSIDRQKISLELSFRADIVYEPPGVAKTSGRESRESTEDILLLEDIVDVSLKE